MLHLAAKAFWPAPHPVPGAARRHRTQLPRGPRLPRPHRGAAGAAPGGGRVQDYIDRGGLRERADGTRNPLQTTPLLDAIAAHRFDAVFGGGRRDEEKARAKERICPCATSSAQWDPRNQRPELWNLYNGRHRRASTCASFPLSQLDRAGHLAVHRTREHRAALHLLRPRARGLRARRHVAGRRRGRAGRATARRVEKRAVRYRTVGDMSCTGAVALRRRHRRRRRSPRSPPATLTERGATRADDRLSEAAMEDRKREGYF